ncbi:uncharacterized protein [Pyxicephalus adspersus]|uniref:US22 family protein n=1 Tax=Pyxicephalus adspersus TaxID=30357 RepID=A0AAV3AJL2_PYXAD|nr:TPA: hypothetical protein GDO54_008034 [Pyxicephalus adspersus]
MMPCCHIKIPNTSMNCLQCYIQGKNGHIISTTEQKEKKMKLQESLPKITSSDQKTNGVHTKNELVQLLESNPVNLALISDAVKKHRDSKVFLHDNEAFSDFYIRVCGLEGTIYSGDTYTLESWEELYLPEPTKMEVLGVLENKKGMVPFPQWLVLLGQDGHVYGYGDDTLHLLATRLKNLLNDGIKNTGIYYLYPHDISDEEEEVLQKDEEIQKIRERTRKYIDQNAEEFNDFLDLF